MNEILSKLSACIEFGKINQASPYPPDMKGQDGADELTKKAIELGISPSDILNLALIPGMDRVGQKFAENKVFVPQMLIAAKAMNKALEHIKPFFASGEIKRKGLFVIGTIMGDLHDIGKNLVAMMVEGAGWEVIDLGVDVKPEQFMNVLPPDKECFIGMSALLTTTMVNMEKVVLEVKSKFPKVKICVGGAPVNDEFRKKIGADFYASGPQGLVNYLNSFAA
ncbi:MAG: cobalamin-dependent protein [Bacteroidales bacterium]